jgi:hypothetical protein
MLSDAARHAKAKAVNSRKHGGTLFGPSICRAEYLSGRVFGEDKKRKLRFRKNDCQKSPEAGFF